MVEIICAVIAGGATIICALVAAGNKKAEAARKEHERLVDERAIQRAKEAR